DWLGDRHVQRPPPRNSMVDEPVRGGSYSEFRLLPPHWYVYALSSFHVAAGIDVGGIEPVIGRGVRDLCRGPRNRLERSRCPERPSRLPVDVPADLPSADQPIRRGAHIPPISPRAAERQIVNAAELPDMRAIVIGRLLHRLRVLRVQE